MKTNILKGKNMKKLLSFLLALVMVTMLMPLSSMTVFAAAGIQSFPALQTAINNAADGDTITLTGDCIATASDSTIEIPYSKTITIDLNGYVIDAGALIVPEETYGNKCSAIFNNGKLTIKDSNGANSTHYFTDSDNDGIYETYTTVEPTVGTEDVDYLKITGGVITGGTGSCISTDAFEGGGVANYYENFSAEPTIFNFEGGNIVGNGTGTTKGAGGGVALVAWYAKEQQCAVNISGGRIAGNAAGQGGGIYNEGIGTKDTNTNTPALLNITGGKIDHNTGGGIYNYASLKIEGTADNPVEISDNISTDNYGVGGIASCAYAENYSTFTVKNCAITNNTSPNYGAGIYTGGSMTLGDGVVISGNKTTNASSYGAGVYCYLMYADDVIALNGDVKIEDNTSAGVKSNLVLNNCEINCSNLKNVIGITTLGSLGEFSPKTFTSGTNTSQFVSDLDSYYIETSDGKLATAKRVTGIDATNTVQVKLDSPTVTVSSYEWYKVSTEAEKLSAAYTAGKVSTTVMDMNYGTISGEDITAVSGYDNTYCLGLFVPEDVSDITFTCSDSSISIQNSYTKDGTTYTVTPTYSSYMETSMIYISASSSFTISNVKLLNETLTPVTGGNTKTLPTGLNKDDYCCIITFGDGSTLKALPVNWNKLTSTTTEIILDNDNMTVDAAFKKITSLESYTPAEGDIVVYSKDSNNTANYNLMLYSNGAWAKFDISYGINDLIKFASTNNIYVLGTVNSSPATLKIMKYDLTQQKVTDEEFGTRSYDFGVYDGKEHYTDDFAIVKDGEIQKPAFWYSYDDGENWTYYSYPDSISTYWSISDACEGTISVKVEAEGYETAYAYLNITYAEADITTADRFTFGEIADQDYTGSAITPDVTIYDKTTEKYLVKDTDYTVEYSNNTNAGTATVTITGIGNYTGTKTATFEITRATTTIYRLYNPNSGEHLYTSFKEEVDMLTKLGWSDEGIAWVSPAESEKPVYRLYNPNSGDHHYTTSVEEQEKLVGLGWTAEGIAWYSGGNAAIYRLFNPNEVIGTHHYTGFSAERTWLTGLGWQDEDIAWYALEIDE